MKRLSAKIDEYTDQQSGQKKGRYVEIGVILNNDNGEYAILNPTIDLAGVLIRQRIMNPEKASKGILCGIFSTEEAKAPAHATTRAPEKDYSDDIPF